VILWVAAASVLIATDALPLLRAAVPRFVVPSKKLTLPEGVPPPEEETVAERLTFAPAVTGFGVAVRAVLVATGPGLVELEPDEPEPAQPDRTQRTAKTMSESPPRTIGSHWADFIDTSKY
jgi:hypothetical protein